MKRQRLDKALVERGIARSRSQAKDLVESGDVLVNGFPVKKPASEVSHEETISLVNPERADWVGRGGRKIEPILEKDWMSVEGRVFLDVGSSTGGFTQALLRSGAHHVHAVDTGEGQLAFELRQDERVSVHEQYNFRYADPEDFVPSPEAFVMDVSFISTRKLIQSLNKVLPEKAEGIFLLKPQFEAGADENVDGIVRDRTVIRRVLDDVLAGWNDRGWGATQLSPSPLKGSTGNQEYFVHVQRGHPRRISQDDIRAVPFQPGPEDSSSV